MIRRYADLVSAAALGTVFVAEVLTESGFAGHRPLNVLIALAFSARRWRCAAGSRRPRSPRAWS